MERQETEMENYAEVLKEKIAQAEMVLVGIGEEFGSTEKQIYEKSEYSDLFLKIGAEEWILPYIYSKILEMETEKTAYIKLAGLLRNKNFFIVSLRTDDYVYKEEFGFPEDRIVTPCGGVRRLQCENNCADKVYDVPAEITEKLEDLFKNGLGGVCDSVIPALKCPDCGSNLVFNKIGMEKYSETGYLPMWERYTKWLQGTLNHRLCILELGVGMRYPSVVRWPFEKIAFFNNKASFFRVNGKLYHLTEELKGKGYAVAQNPIEFLTNSFE